MTMTPLRAVLFDVGGVFITQRMNPVNVTEILGLDINNPFEVSAADHAVWSHRDSHDEGMSDEEFWCTIALDLGVEEPAPEVLQRLVHQDVVRMNNADSEALRVADLLKEAGYELGILANSPVSVAAEVKSADWARERFSTFIFSGDYGQRKPKSKIYQIAAEAMGLDPEHILFVDDRSKHVRTAQYLGMQGLVWNSPESAEAELRERHIIRS